MAKRRIGILTGGGDVPGLNAVIKSVTYRGSENDIAVRFRRSPANVCSICYIVPMLLTRKRPNNGM
jgi:hypothetical protein